jgi:hypothetical protein
MSVNTSHEDEAGPSNSGTSNPKTVHHTSNQSPSTNISLGSLLTHTQQPRPRRTNPTFHIRSKSDQPVLYRKIKVIPVAEQTPTTLQKSLPSSFASSKVSVTGLGRRILNTTPSSSTPEPFQDGRPEARPSRPTIHWNRTSSGGVWFARLTGGNRRELQQSSDSSTSTSYFFRPGQNVITPLPKPALRPSTRSGGSTESGYHREVKLETPFTASIISQPEPQKPPKMRLSLNPRVMFSNTILLARRFSLRGRLNKSKKDVLERPVEGSSQKLSPIHTLTHSTALRPNETSSVLQRVTSILSETEAQKSPHHSDLPRLLSSKRTFSLGFVGGGGQRHHTTRFASGAPSRRTPSVSYTSSQNDLRMGLVPTGTPAHDATYKVGNQVFFKVDISIRGGTSYLPSEARRIHTPPLPSEETHVQGPPSPEGRRFVKMKPRGESVNQVRLPKPPDMQPAFPRDWYDVQLQLLEPEARPALSHMFGEADVPIDYDIPEHLPSSPLCPKHDRYWRYIQGKLKPGEQIRRVCWMHGVRGNSGRE